MRRLTTGLLVLGLSIAALSGCQRSSVINISPGPPARFYVGNFITSNLQVFNQPLTPTSTPAFALATPSNVGGIAVDKLGNIYVPNGTNISVFPPPTSATTTATNFGPIAGAGSFRGAAIDQSGNLWVADATGRQAFEFTLPLTGAPPAPIRTLQCACFLFPFSLAFDLGGHLFVGDDGGGGTCPTGCVDVVNIPSATGTSVLPAVAVIASPGASGIGVDVKDRLFVSSFSGEVINVFNPPFATGNVPAFSISPPGNLTTPEQMLFDASGNLYVAYFSDSVLGTGGIAIFNPPLSAASGASLIVGGAGSGINGPNAPAFAP